MADRRSSTSNGDEVPRSRPNRPRYPLNTGLEQWDEENPAFPLPRERLRQGDFSEFPEERMIVEDDDASHGSGSHPPPDPPREQHPAPGPSRHRAPARREWLPDWFSRTVQPSGQGPGEPRLRPARGGDCVSSYVPPRRPASRGDGHGHDHDHDHEPGDGGPRVLPPERDIPPLDLGSPVSSLPGTPPRPGEPGADIPHEPAAQEEEEEEEAPAITDGRLERLREYIRRWLRRHRELKDRRQRELEGGILNDGSPQDDERPTSEP
ncbi:hypothetical protein VPNG_04148 [Cytospora leucostoma]|uniref:Uncharacterized protein n=1 Tax=Cytospora leucostoma TaxID=1230097 RepID=A0A423XDF4_9PEZI|nr:hypothetical protein VPNG_04148 [Cytospora leucostoma]